MVQEAGRIADLIQGFLSYCRGLDSRATLSVFSDHGMLPLRGTVDVSKALGARTDRKPWTVLLDATMARFWWNDPRPGDWAAVQDAMKGLPGHFLSDMELEVHGIRFGGAYGELVWLADPGIQIVPSHMASVPLGGMHGYDPVHPLMKASFLSTGRDEPAPEAIWELREWMEPSREVHEQPMVLEVSR